MTYFDTAAKRRALSRAIAAVSPRVTTGPSPSICGRWKPAVSSAMRTCRLHHDQVLGSALYQVISHNARCYGLPGVYSYLPGLTNVTAMRAFGDLKYYE